MLDGRKGKNVDARSVLRGGEQIQKGSPHNSLQKGELPWLTDKLEFPALSMGVPRTDAYNPNQKEILKGNIARANVIRKLQLKGKIPL